MSSYFQLPFVSHYWLRNGRVPLTLLHQSASGVPLTGFQESGQSPENQSTESLVSVDIEVNDGRVVAVRPIDAASVDSASVDSASLDSASLDSVPSGIPSVDVCSGLIWPCFVDMHTHLDKGHIWSRSPNPEGTFAGALETVQQDSAQRWDADDVYRRADFGLKCSYAHGTQAIRTHLDAFDGQGEISFEVFRQLRESWRNKLVLQAVCLVTLDYFMEPKGEKLADLVASSGGVLGGVAFTNPDIVQQIDRVFALAKERGLDLDFHTDESLNPSDISLRHVAQAAIRHQFEGRITCGHCCSLSVQSAPEMRKTLSAVKAANISVVSLPMCNLYLQNRQPGHTPRYRGVTVLHELKAAGVKVALASDNCRDPFFAYGDHDGLEVFTQSARIGHLDHPIADWPQAITSIPAEMMGLSDATSAVGQIGEGESADFVVFKARSFNELMSRPQSDRVVIRQGKQIDTTLPDYAELDDLMS